MANRIVDRPKQKIISGYKWRWDGFHRGLDLRSWTDPIEGQARKRLDVMLPCDCEFVRKTNQKKWGWTLVFRPFNSIAEEIKFTHITDKNFVTDKVYQKGFVIGQSCMTDHMIKLSKKGKVGEHIHFETWRYKKNKLTGLKKLVHFNPIEFLKEQGVDYD